MTKKLAVVVSFLVVAFVGVLVWAILTGNQLSETRDTLSSTRTQLVVTTTELGDTKQTLTSTKTELNTTKLTLASTNQSLTLTKAELEDTKQTLTSTKTELNTTKLTLASTQEELSSTQQTLSSAQNALETTKAKLEAADAKLKLYKETLGIDVFSGVQPPFEKPRGEYVSLTNSPTATNPSWQQLISFLLSDRTDDEYYNETLFNCTNFAEMLHNNAEAAGIKAAFVAVLFKNEPEGHALNAIKTVDHGLVYVDCTGMTEIEAKEQALIVRVYRMKAIELDKIAYLVKGKKYGVVSIDRAAPSQYWENYERVGKSLSWWKSMGIVESIRIYW